MIDMVELNLKQITDKLNAEFVGDVRKLIFWYDVNADFESDIDTLVLDNAKVLHLQKDNQFYIKYFLECEDTTTNYLVYAPFAKPAIRENHLADTLRYSKEFFVDRASLLTLDLGMDERLKPVIQHYIKFFASKDRTQRFYNLELDTFNKSTIETAMMSVLCKLKASSFEEVMRAILTDDDFDGPKYIAEFERYDLLDAFWQHTEELFGYTDSKPTLEKLAFTLFVTYASKTIRAELPQAWKPYVSFKSGNIITFLDSLMNSYLYSECYDALSQKVFEGLKAAAVLAKLPIEALIECGVFAGVDQLFIRWMIERLENEDKTVKLGRKTIKDICQERQKMHFGSRYRTEYSALENAYRIIAMGAYFPVSGLDKVIQNYTERDCGYDLCYRRFYQYYDQLEDGSNFEKLRELIEKLYTNEYLNKITVNWNAEMVATMGRSNTPLQTGFYDRYVKSTKERTVVIISDAMRYEVGKSLFKKLQGDEKCTVTMTVMQSILPSITRYGMAALLPHSSLQIESDGKILVDGKPTDDLKQREAVLQSFALNSRCVQYDDIKAMKVAELREVFTGQDVVYVYHNQIDARGDKPNTENEVFAACEEAVAEIHALIRRLTTSANTVHFIVTADHGFLYKRDKLNESDKITGASGKGVQGRRYIIGDQALDTDGISSVALKAIFGGDDPRMVTFPMGSDVFKLAGGGQNYVHGGSSPQEMLIPVIDVKTEKGHKETSTAQIAMISLTSKITNLITTLDFIQTEAISDVVKETTYRIYFITDEDEVISNENLCIADKKDQDSSKRIIRLRFSFKNRQYDKAHKYYLVARDEKNGLEVLRQEMIMDIAFADDFGF